MCAARGRDDERVDGVHAMVYNGSMSTATVILPDSSIYSRKTEAAYTHAAVISFDRAHAITCAEARVESLQAVVGNDSGFEAPLRKAIKALAALRVSDDERAYEVVSLHHSYRAADEAALRAARRRCVRSLVVRVVRH